MEERNVLDTLIERGFVAQMTHENEIRQLLGNEKITFYIGFDPTADSLHVGHFLQVMVMSHMQRAGHRPIALVGGGTGMVGDTTDRTDMRRMMTKEEIDHNCECFKKQIGKFVEFGDDKAIMLDNGEWLRHLNYIDFMRTYGVHFSVNRMLTADSYRKRFEQGLSFFEFNYMLLQSYDFLELNRRLNCKMQFGGNDQWSNIIGGIELIRKVEGKDVYGLTFNLLTTSDGQKMGKTVNGAVWLDPEKTSPYEFYQYWRNVEDVSVINYLKLLTFLPMEEIEEFAKLEGKDINKAKEVLAFEITKIVHSEEEAKKAMEAAKALFEGGQQGGSIPFTTIPKSTAQNGINIIELLETAGLIDTRSEGRRLITQNGLSVNGEKVSNHELVITLNDFKDNELMIQKGKKVYHKIIVQ